MFRLVEHLSCGGANSIPQTPRHHHRAAHRGHFYAVRPDEGMQAVLLKFRLPRSLSDAETRVRPWLGTHKVVISQSPPSATFTTSFTREN
jgi:hypothetical protein